MTTPDELQHKIERLAAAGAPAATGRRLAPFGGRSLLSTLLVEVDETMLGRTLRVANATGGEMLLDVHNRRLLQLRAPGADRNGAQGESVLWRPSDPPDTGTVTALRDLLDGFIGDSETLLLRGDPGALSHSADMLGISAKRLAEDWGLALAPPAEQPLADVLDAILAESKEHVVTWVRRQDGHTDCGGDSTLFDQAEALTRSLESSVFAPSPALPTLSRDRCVFTLDRYGKAGLGVILASFEGVLVTLLVRPVALNRLAGRLQEVLHGWHRAA